MSSLGDRMKQRLVGAAVLVLAAVVFVPMLLDPGDEEPQPRERDIVTQPPVDAPARVVPLEADAKVPASAPAAPPAPPAEASTKPSAAPAKSPSKASTRTPTKTASRAGTFAVQLGSFSKADNAEGLRDKLLADGYAAFIETSGSVTRVYVGPQSSRAEAEKMVQKLLTETKLRGIVVNFSG